MFVCPIILFGFMWFGSVGNSKTDAFFSTRRSIADASVKKCQIILFGFM